DFWPMRSSVLRAAWKRCVDPGDELLNNWKTRHHSSSSAAGGIVESAADNSMASAQSQSSCEADDWRRQPVEVASSDPDVLRAALIREAAERRRAECRVKIQSE